MLQFEKVNEVEVEIPYIPRPEFDPYHDRTQRFAKIVAHRRYGKTVGCVNDLIRRALLNTRREPTPRYAYIGPTYVQVKDVAWSYLKHYTAQLPKLQMSESELWVKLPNGAQIGCMELTTTIACVALQRWCRH